MTGADSTMVELTAEIAKSLNAMVVVMWLILIFKDCNGANAIRRLSEELKYYSNNNAIRDLIEEIKKQGGEP